MVLLKALAAHIMDDRTQLDDATVNIMNDSAHQVSRLLRICRKVDDSVTTLPLAPEDRVRKIVEVTEMRVAYMPTFNGTTDLLRLL